MVRARSCFSRDRAPIDYLDKPWGASPDPSTVMTGLVQKRRPLPWLSMICHASGNVRPGRCCRPSKVNAASGAWFPNEVIQMLETIAKAEAGARLAPKGLTAAFLGWLTGALPTALVLAGLAALAVAGHHT